MSPGAEGERKIGRLKGKLCSGCRPKGLRNNGLVQLSFDEGRGMANVIKKLFTNTVAVKSEISFYTLHFKSISRLGGLCGKA